MPKLAVTPKASALIKSERQAGTPYRDIQTKVKDQLGIDLDHKTIEHHWNSLNGKPRKRGKPNAAQPSKVIKTKKKVKTSLDQVGILEKQAKAFQVLVAQDLPPRDLVALNGELRATLKQLQEIKDAASEKRTVKNQDVAHMVQKLTKFAEDNPEELESDSEDADDPLRQEQNTASGA